MESISLQISGMSCGHCVANVRRALDAIDGVQVEQVGVGSARVAYDPSRTGPAVIAKAVEEEGYGVQPEGAK